MQHTSSAVVRASLLLLCGLAALSAAFSTPQASTGTPRPVALLWRDPGDVSLENLFWGSGSPGRAPRAPFTFLKEDTDGTKPKVHVVDAAGVKWHVKFDDGSNKGRGREVPAEIAASRITWALGYFVDECYLVRRGVIRNIGPLRRARRVIGPDGRFTNARFERRPPNVRRTGEGWSLRDNPFVGSRQLSGLIILVALLNNWDVRPANTDVLRVKYGDREEDRYLLSDLGTAFGNMTGGPLSKPTRWSINDYQTDRGFIVRADDTMVELYYRPDGTDPARVPLEHARWFSDLASQLTPHQIKQALRAAGASPSEVRAFTQRFMEKLAELRQATHREEPRVPDSKAAEVAWNSSVRRRRLTLHSSP